MHFQKSAMQTSNYLLKLLIYYPSDHFLFSNVNKKVVLKLKEEAAGKIIEEFIALKPKLYLLKYAA